MNIKKDECSRELFKLFLEFLVLYILTSTRLKNISVSNYFRCMRKNTFNYKIERHLYNDDASYWLCALLKRNSIDLKT